MSKTLHRMWKFKDQELHFEKPMIMGILNVTPDSFSDGGRFSSIDSALKQATSMIQAGATIIDVGGESSRPGSSPVSEELELSRIQPVITVMKKELDCLISIDTRNAAVAKVALDLGAEIINDISGGSHDTGMFPLLKETRAGYVLMHMQGLPETMQTSPRYADVQTSINSFFASQMAKARTFDVDMNQIVLDPGIGFGKTLEHNLQIMGNMTHFDQWQRPLLLGASRKSFIGMLDGSEVQSRLGGSLAAVLAALVQGVQIFRVHDVQETKQAIDIFTAIQSHSD